MALYQVVILAVVQALTEFLPISSSAHLALAPWLFGWEDQGLIFDIALHFGTLAAVLIYFARDWMQVLANGFGRTWGSDPELRANPRLLWLIALGSIPVGITGLLFQDLAETSWRSPYVIGVSLITVGIVMAVADHISRRERNMAGMGVADAGVIGLAQAIAVVPGTSRSGITITAALFRNIDRHAAARFSFLLSTPAIGGAALKASYDLWKHGGIPAGKGWAFVVGVTVSTAVGCVVIRLLLQYLRSHSLKVFIWYRIIFGVVVLGLAAAGLK
ncbi:MAG: undecaprenyl-diphosphate phosphatase [Acidobacteria bacterium]|nr:undecaprenyl-diphosphate phosphatase [Acidobacteriota bacterium]